jgi:hypothetical protein
VQITLNRNQKKNILRLHVFSSVRFQNSEDKGRPYHVGVGAASRVSSDEPAVHSVSRYQVRF